MFSFNRFWKTIFHTVALVFTCSIGDEFLNVKQKIKKLQNIYEIYKKLKLDKSHHKHKIRNILLTGDKHRMNIYDT